MQNPRPTQIVITAPNPNGRTRPFPEDIGGKGELTNLIPKTFCNSGCIPIKLEGAGVMGIPETCYEIIS